MLNRITIGSKMAMLAGVSIVLLLGTGGLGLAELASAKANLEALFDNSLVPLTNLNQMAEFCAILPGSVGDIEMGRLDAASAAERIRTNRDASSKAWAAYLQSASSGREAELQLLMRGPIQRVSEVSRRLEEMLEAMGGVTTATLDAVQIAERRTRLRSYFDVEAQPAIQEVRGLLGRLSHEQIESARRELSESSQQFAEYSGKITLIVAVGIAFMLLFGYWIRRSATSSLQRINDSLHRLATNEADLTQRLKIESDDEIGSLATSFNRFMQRLETMVKQAHMSGIQVQSGTNELTAGAKELEATVTQQVASTTEVVASAKQISATGAQLTQEIAMVSEMAQSTAWTAGEGQQGLRRMDETMAAMQSASTNIADKLAAITDRAENIASIVTTINKIADQTNLLSLNASIEAEKAGEYGQGFAVVAREIRRLADQTAVSTLDIEKMVKDMKATVVAGVMSADKFKEAVRGAVGTVAEVSARLSEIIEQIQALSPRFDAVGSSAEAQSLGARQISEAMVQLGAATRSTAERMRRNNQALDELTTASRGLQAEFSRFAVGLGGDNGAGTGLPRG